MPSSDAPSVRESIEYPRPVVPSRTPTTEYPLIDNDPHFTRVWRYMRPSDYAAGAAIAALNPALFYYMEKASPSYVAKRSWKSVFRMNIALGLGAAFFMMTWRSSNRFYGVTENAREAAMDMREMVDRIKAGKPPYGESQLTEYMQGVAARNSRYSAVLLHLMPMFNFANHPHHGVDTAKYYQQAEQELEAERLSREGGS